MTIQKDSSRKGFARCQRLGIKTVAGERFHFWKLFFWSLFRKPRLFPLAITYAIYGFHFRKIAEGIRGSGMFDSGGQCLE